MNENGDSGIRIPLGASSMEPISIEGGDTDALPPFSDEEDTIGVRAWVHVPSAEAAAEETASDDMPSWNGPFSQIGEEDPTEKFEAVPETAIGDDAAEGPRITD